MHTTMWVPVQCPHTFDETLMFVGKEGEGFRKQVTDIVTLLWHTRA